MISAATTNVTSKRRGPSRHQRLARQRWGKKAVWLAGDGAWAVLAGCNDALSVFLCPDQDAAESALLFIERVGCGSRCVRDHLVVRLGR
jgi:hypothetical protein